MKKTGKILSLVFCLALMVCAIVASLVFNTSAADTTTYVRTGETTGYDYVHKDNAGRTGTIAMTHTTDLEEAFVNALRYTTIYLNGDYTYTFEGSNYINVGYRLKPTAGQTQGDVNVNNEGGPFTFDLGGHKLTIIQNNWNNVITLGSVNKLTIINGTLES